MKLMKLFFVLMLTLVVSGCATKVTRVEVNKVTDFSGKWNDTDARLTAEEMVKDCLEGLWINNFNKVQGRTPVVIVGSIKNNTFEHISSSVFVEDLQRVLINSGKVSFVAAKDARSEIRQERLDQLEGNTEPSTISQKGHETGADFMLQGAINSIKDSVKGKYSVFYQVDLELLDMRTNQKVWIGQKKIKKVVERPSVSV